MRKRKSWFAAVFIFFLTCNACYAETQLFEMFVADYGQEIAVEMQQDNKFVDEIGKLYIATNSTIFDEVVALEVVTFAAFNETVIAAAHVYKILEQSSISSGNYHIRCQQQRGIIYSGTINLTDPLKPKIMLISDRGLVLTNISNSGLRMKQKYLEYIDLGV